MVLVVAGFDALDEGSLGSADDVDLVPLKKEVGEGYAAASHDIA